MDIHKIENTINRWPTWQKVAFSAAMTWGLGYLDYKTGYEISFSLFYLIPILFSVWFVSRYSAIWFSIISTLIWLYADIRAGLAYSNPYIHIWNASVRLTFFLIITYMLSAIRVMFEAERKLSRQDFLTCVSNSRQFNETLSVEFTRSERNAKPLSIAYMDIDNFKNINDTHGHLQGDKTLKLMCDTIVSDIRSSDTLARMGGDEFALLMPETSQSEAKVIVNRIQASLESTLKGTGYPISFSIGVITCKLPCPKHTPCSPEYLIKQADDLMYTVKHDGKNAAVYKSCPE